MLKINKILVPTDFSDGAKDAYKYARAVAKRFGGKIDFIHVIPILKYLNESIGKLGLPLDMDKDIYPKILTNAKKRLEDELILNIPEEFRGTVHVKVNRKAHESICEIAQKEHYEMIVMGSKGSHENSLLKGTTAEKVIRHSEVPVLCVQGELPPKGVNRVLVPTDYSSLSITPIEYAVSMASSLESEITILHVLELYGSPIENEPRGEAGRGDLDSMSRKILDKVKKHLDENQLGERTWTVLEEDGKAYLYKAAPTERKIRLNVAVVRGISAHYAIVDFANAESDMIVMSTHGRSGLSHLFLGSTAERVIMSSDVPVLTVRPAKKSKS
jgi:nucleotide-binding universal stress UspA family protein